MKCSSCKPTLLFWENICERVGALYITGEHGEPLQADLQHVEGFLGLVQADGLRALLLDVQLQVILQITANT